MTVGGSGLLLNTELNCHKNVFIKKFCRKKNHEKCSHWNRCVQPTVCSLSPSGSLNNESPKPILSIH